MEPGVSAQAKPTESGEDGAAAAHASETAAEPCQAVSVTSRAGESSPEGIEAYTSKGGGAIAVQKGNLPSTEGG